MTLVILQDLKHKVNRNSLAGFLTQAALPDGHRTNLGGCYPSKGDIVLQVYSCQP